MNLGRWNIAINSRWFEIPEWLPKGFISVTLGWPRSTVEKGPQSDESYERENPWNRTISTVLWVHKKLPQSTVKLVLPSNESYESKTGCNRTLATVLWVPLSFISVQLLSKFILWRFSIRNLALPGPDQPLFANSRERLQQGSMLFSQLQRHGSLSPGYWKCKKF